MGVIYKVSFRVKPMYKLRMKDTFPLVSTFTNKDLETLVKNSEGIEVFYWPFNSSRMYVHNVVLRRVWETYLLLNTI